MTSHAQTTDPDSAQALGQAVAAQKPPLGGPKQVGAIPLGNLKPVYQTTDITLRGTLGNVSLTRHFSADDNTWGLRDGTQGMLIQGPFGNAPDSAWSMYWWHNFFSYVDVRPMIRHIVDGEEVFHEEVWSVRAPGGAAHSFSPCSTGLTTPCSTTTWTDPTTGSVRSIADDVELHWDGTGFVLYRRGVGRYLFRQLYSEQVDSGPVKTRKVYFLSEIQDQAGRTLVTLTYLAPGSTRVSEVITPEGSRLRFHYETRPDGSSFPPSVLVWVGVVDAQGNETEAIRYDYLNGQAGLLSVSKRSNGSGGYRDHLRYGYGSPVPNKPGTKWVVGTGDPLVADVPSEAGVTLIEQTLGWNATAIQTDADPNGTRTITTQNVDPTKTCTPGQLSLTYGPYSCDWRQYQRIRQTFASYGAGTLGNTDLMKEFLVELLDGQGPTVRSATEWCIGASCGDAQLRSSAWNWISLGTTGKQVPDWAQDYLGAYTKYAFATGPSGNPELVGLYAGASSAAGAGALSSTWFAYKNGTSPSSFVPRLVDSEARPSVLMQGAQATTKYRYDAQNRVVAKIQTGYTREFQSGTWGTVQRFIGTFYFTHQECASSSAPEDPLGRVVEIHGPCEVDSIDDTDCRGGEVIPLTQLVYYPANAAGNNANRLERVRVFTDGRTDYCEDDTNPFETVYTQYDARGRVRESVDPNGTMARFTYDGERLVQTQRGDSAATMLTTTYGYDDAAQKTLWVRKPTGEYEVTCYRVGTSPAYGCAGGTISDKLQWRALAPNANGTGASEWTRYSYRDGRLVREEILDATGQVRRTSASDMDVYGRTTFQQSGDPAASGGTQPVTRTAFDAADHLTKLGLPYNAAPAFCQVDPSGAYRPCAELAYDRLGRLTELRRHPSGQLASAYVCDDSVCETDPVRAGNASASSCVDYDAHGNLSKWASGCTDDCGTCLSASNKQVAIYQHDDFDHVVEVSAPWLGDTTAGGGSVKMSYDALGNVLFKQSPLQAMQKRYELHQVDGLDRPVMSRLIQVGPGQQEILSSTAYDGLSDPFSPASACPFPTAHGNGKPSSIADGAGKTCFSYDAQGNVIRAARVDVAGKKRNAASAFVGSETQQQYDSAGRLAAQQYPDGRHVSYDYWPASSRVKSISVELRNADGTSAVTKLVDNIQWEAFGGVRSYEILAIKAAPGAQVLGVEYLPGNNGAFSADCGMARPSGNDGTGRVQGLWVSRGGTAGDIYRARYQWSADQLVQQAECFKNTSAQQPARVVRYQASNGGRGYDYTLQLRSFKSSAQSASTLIAYDARGNRVSEQGDVAFGYTYSNGAAGEAADRMTARQFVPHPWETLSRREYGYTVDGWLTGMRWSAFDGFNDVNPNWEPDGDVPQLGFSYGYSPGLTPAYVGATQGNAQARSVSGYYHYDATGHRVRKELTGYGGTSSGTSIVDEMFWSGDKLMEDRGNAKVGFTSTEARSFPIDQYIWLDNHPIVMIKSQVTGGTEQTPSFTRKADFTGDCTRDGEYAPCGVYFMVDDVMGRPVVMLDAAGKITGTGEYDPFGQVNREARESGSSHPHIEGTEVVADLESVQCAGTGHLRAGAAAVCGHGGGGLHLRRGPSGTYPAAERSERRSHDQPLVLAGDRSNAVHHQQCRQRQQRRSALGRGGGERRVPPLRAGHLAGLDAAAHAGAVLRLGDGPGRQLAPHVRPVERPLRLPRPDAALARVRARDPGQGAGAARLRLRQQQPDRVQ
ncbi:MAG: RHS repeat protein [Minicystis sp.]